MIITVTGGRDFEDRWMVARVLGELHADHHIRLLRHGAARGADSLCDDWAKRYGVPRQAFPARWDLYGRSAGPMRNIEMLDATPRSDLLVAFPGGRGTGHARQYAERLGIPVRDLSVEEPLGIFDHVVLDVEPGDSVPIDI